MKSFCASCVGVDVEKIIKTNNEKLPKWLEKVDYVTNFIKQSKLVPYKQKKTKMKLKLNVGKENANKYILYWGAQPSINLNIKDAKQAYKNFTNYGVSKVDKKGDVVFYFNCPQPYKTTEKNKTQPETYYRHIHFCYANKENTKWIDKVYTKVVICDISLSGSLHLLKKNRVVMLNALPCEYYAKFHIPNTYNLDVKTAKKFSQKQLLDWMLDVIKINYNSIYQSIKNKKINLYEIPIIVYCVHEKCNAAHDLAIELLKKGFVNLLYYKGGTKEYLLKKHRSHKQTKTHKRKTHKRENKSHKYPKNKSHKYPKNKSHKYSKNKSHKYSKNNKNKL